MHSRLSEMITVVILGALCGAALGYQMGHSSACWLAEDSLDQYAVREIRMVEARVTESHEVMAAMAAQRFVPCSEAEIEGFRQLVLRAEYLKDAGRIHDGRIECSASAGKTLDSGERFAPDFQQKNGTTAYKNLVPVQPGKAMMVGLQQGDMYVILGSQAPDPSGPIPMQVSINLKRASGQSAVHLRGESLAVEASVLLTDGRWRIGTTLYATRCSMRYMGCATAYAPAAVALRVGRRMILGGAVGGTLLGALLGLALALAYVHSRGLAQQLRRAVSNGKMQVVYQPVVDIASGAIVGAEALVRWNDDTGLAISPIIFIGIAEERGFIGEITRLVLHRVLRDFKETLRREPDFHINMNIAAADLADPAFIPELEGALKRAGVDGKSLGIEITESGTARYQVAKDAIQRLRGNGHTVYIDDFGTGYSSLAYLHDLEVDAIKVDRAFTQAIGTDSVTVNILPQILAMAEALDLQVVVEGVETRQQAGYFAGATKPILAQGWLFGRPASAKEFHRILAERKALGTAGPFQPLEREKPHLVGAS